MPNLISLKNLFEDFVLGTLQYKNAITAQKHDYNSTRTRLQHKNQHHEYLAEASDYSTTKAIQNKNTIANESLSNTALSQ